MSTIFKKGFLIVLMVNPFIDYFSELFTLDSRNYGDGSVVSTHGTVEAVGKQHNHDFPKAVTVERMQKNHATIKKNGFALFKKQQPKIKSKAEPKNNVAAEQCVSAWPAVCFTLE